MASSNASQPFKQISIKDQNRRAQRAEAVVVHGSNDAVARDVSSAGFSLVELMIACTVMLAALATMAYLATSALSDLALAKEHQAANGILDEAIERVRALPYDTTKLGMRTSDLVGDARVSGAGTPMDPYRLRSNGERLVHASTTPAIEPLVPNSRTRTVANLTYTSRVYITYFDDDPTSGALLATAFVEWRSRHRGGRVLAARTQTVVFSPAGCRSTSTHPFAAPCQAFSYVAAATKPGQINTRAEGSGPDLLRASIDSPGTSAAMQIEQMTSVQGTASGGGVTAKDAPSGYAAVTTKADDDPASSGSVAYDSRSASGGAAAQSSATLGWGSMSLTASAVDTAESVSTTTASSTNVCLDGAGAPQVDELPCGRSRARQMGVLQSLASLSVLGLGDVTTGEILAAPTDSVSYVNRDVASTGVCSGTSGNGCVHGYASRSIGRVRVGGFPGLTAAPLGWLGFVVEVSGYQDAVSAEAGIGAGAPTTSRTGTVRYWNGLGYTTASLSDGPNQTLSIPSIQVTASDHQLTLTSDLRTGGSSSSSSLGTCGTSTCRTSANATIASPVTGTVTLKIESAGATVLELTTTVDLGESSVAATYSDPPSA